MKRLTLASVFLLSILFAITSNVFGETKTWKSTISWRPNNATTNLTEGDYSFKNGGTGTPAVANFTSYIEGPAQYYSLSAMPGNETYTEGTVTAIYAAWKQSGTAITMEVSANNGGAYTTINNGETLLSGFTPGNQLRWRAGVPDFSILQEVELAYRDNSPVNMDFGNPYLSGFKNRKSVIIRNSGSALNNYQLLLKVGKSAGVSNLTCNNHVKSDFSDIRFTTSDGKTPINHFTEFYNTTVGKIYLKIPYLANNTNTTIYMYYNNTQAGSASDPERVFDFYDDFNRESLDTTKWSVPVGSSYKVRDGLIIENENTRIQSKQAFSHPVIQEVKVRMSTQGTYGMMLAGFYQNDSDNLGISGDHGTQSYNDIYLNGVDSTAHWFYFNRNYIIGVQGSGFSDSKITVYDDSFSSLSSYTKSFTVENDYIALGKLYDNNSHASVLDYIYDWVRIRKYANQFATVDYPNPYEPVSADVGSEEAADTPVHPLAYFQGTTINKKGDLGLGLTKGSEPHEKVDTDVSGTVLRKFKDIKISHTAANQTDYPVRIRVEYDADMQGNFSEVRFTPQDNHSVGAELAFWKDNTASSDYQYAEYWVKIPSLTQNNVTNISMCYGNLSEKVIPIGQNVFTFFDDFSNNATISNYEKFTQDASHPTWFPATDTDDTMTSPSNIYINATTKSLVMNGYPSSTTYAAVVGLKKGGSSLTVTDVALKTRIQHTNTFYTTYSYIITPIWLRFSAIWDGGYDYEYSGYFTSFGINDDGSYVNAILGKRNVETETYFQKYNTGWHNNEIHGVEFRAYGSKLATYLDDVLLAYADDSTFSSGRVVLATKAIDMRFKDYLVVRKYVDPEPVVSWDTSTGIYVSQNSEADIPYNIRNITSSWLATPPGTNVNFMLSAYNDTVGNINWTGNVVSGAAYNATYIDPDFIQGKNLRFRVDFFNNTSTTVNRTTLNYNMNPVVTQGNIDVVNLTGAQGMSPSGTNSIYRAGDKIKVTWNNNNTLSGDNNTYLYTALCNFSQLNATFPDETMNVTGGLYQTNGAGFSIPAYASYALEDTNWATGNNTDPSQAKKIKVKAIVNSTLGILTETIDDANLYLDNTPPNVTASKINITPATPPNAYGAYKAGDRIEAKWAHSKSSTPAGDTNWDSEIVSAIIELVNGTSGANILTNSSALKVTNSGFFGNFSVSSSNPMDYSNVDLKVTAYDNANNNANATNASTNLIIDSILPVINTTYLNVTTGKGKTYRSGDTITLEWNNTGTAQNSPNDIVNATANFSAFGDTSGFAGMSNSGNIYTRSYTIQNGSIDNTGFLNLAIKARDDAGNELQVLTPDNFYIYCDNYPPQVSASNISIVSLPNGENNYYKLNGLIQAKWAHYPSNADTEIVSAIFQLINGTSGAVILTNSTPLKNSNNGFYADFPITASPLIDWNDIDVRVMGTDNAWNNNTTTNTTAILYVDNIIPVVNNTYITIPTGINKVYKANDAFSSRWDNNGTTQNDPNDIVNTTVNLTAFGGNSSQLMFKSGDVYNYTFNIPNNGNLDNASLQVFVKAKDHAGNENTPVGSPATYNISCDNKLPLVNNAYITFPTGNKLYRAGEPITVQWNNTNATAQNNPNDIVSAIVNLTAFGGNSSLSMVKSGDLYNYTYNIPATGGTIDNLNLTVSIIATDDAVNTNIPVNSRDLGIGLDNKLPVVTSTYINVTSGLNKIYKIGDTLSVAWNNANATGQNNPNDILEAFVNLTSFGGGNNVSMGGSGQVYSSNYIIQNGTIENTNNLQVFVKAKDEANNYNAEVGSPIGYNILCDNVAPRMTSANITLYKPDNSLYVNNDMVKVDSNITAKWAYGAGGDNNNDINSSSVFANLSQFGGNSNQQMSLVSNVYQASYVVQNSTAVGRVIDGGSLRVTVSAKDDADNPVGPVNNAITLQCDNQPPKMEYITISPASVPPVYKTGDTITVTWDSSNSGDDNTDLDPGIPPTVDFTQFGGSKVNMSVVSPRIYRASYAIKATDPAGGHDLEVASTDDAGNKSVKTFRLTVMLGYFIDPPAAGSSWSLGSAIPITWAAAGGANPSNVTILYSYNNGGNYSQIVSGYVPNNSYEWVPGQISNQAKIKIIDKTNTTISSESGAFYITGKITITSPGVDNSYSDALARWPVGKPQTIQWDILGTMDNYAIFVDGTQVGTSNTTSFSYTPDNPLNPATIRVTDITPGHALAENSKQVVFSDIAINPPNAATIWQQNSAHDIRWTQTGLERVSLFYLAGNNTTTIATGVSADDLAYNWTIPPQARSPSTQVQVVDTFDTTGGAKFTTANFTIVGRLQLNDPPATVGVNEAYNITWTTPNGPIPRVSLYLINAQNGAIAQTITPTPIVNSGSYSWTPTQTLPQVKIRICDADFANNNANAYDETSIFSISGISVTPLPKSTYLVNEPIQIQWGQTGMQGNTVDISYTYTDPTNGNQVTQTIRDNWTTGASGSYPWQAPDTISKNVVIHVKDHAGPATGDSNAFNISGSLTVQTPVSGSVFSVTDDASITWNTLGSIPKVNLEYSLNGGSAWQPVKDSNNQDATNINNTGSFNWTIPGSALSQNVYLRVISANTLHPYTEGRSGQIQIGAKLSFDSPMLNDKWAIGSTQGINWTVIGDVSRVKLEYAVGPNFNSWTTIADPVVNSGTSGTYPWNVPRVISVPRHDYIDTDPNQIQLKLRISDVTANHLPVPQVSSAFLAHYFKVIWNVFNIQSGGPVTNLKVDDTSGWKTTDFSSLSPGDNMQYYPYGSFMTSWSLQDGSLESLSNRTTRINDDNTEVPDSEPKGISPWLSDRSQRRQVFMEVVSQEAVVWNVRAQSHYAAANQQVQIATWLEKTGSIVTNFLEWAQVDIYDFEDGSLIRELTNSAADANGSFRINWDLTDNNGIAVPDGKTYFAKVTIQRKGRGFTSAEAINIAVPKKVLSNELSNQTSQLEASLSTLINQTTLIKEDTGALRNDTTAIRNETDKIQAIKDQTDRISAIQENVTAVRSDTGRILVATENLTSQITTAQSAIEQRIDLRTGVFEGEPSLREVIENKTATLAQGIAALPTREEMQNFFNITNSQLSIIEAAINTIDGTIENQVMTKLNLIQSQTDTINWGQVSSLVTTTGEIKDKTDYINWSDIAEIKTATGNIKWSDIDYIKAKADVFETGLNGMKGDITKLLAEIGTGNIAAIKTATDTIKWDDVTGLVTSTGEIKAKTDLLSTDIVGIKTKTDTINWSEVTGIKTKADTIDLKAEDLSGILGAIQSKTTAMKWDDIEAIKLKLDALESGQREAAVTAQKDNLNVVGDQLAGLSELVKKMNSVKSPEVDKILAVERTRASDIVYLKKKTQEIKAMIKLNQDLMDNVAYTPVVHSWLEFQTAEEKAKQEKKK